MFTILKKFKKNYKKVFNFMNEIKKHKLTKKIGVSLYNPEYLEKIKKEYNLDIVQAPINIVDRRFLSANVKKLLRKKIYYFKQDQFFYKELF